MAIAKYTESVQATGSSNIHTVYYNDDSQILWVAFLSGSTIGYRNVPRHIFDGFKNAIRNLESAGKYYNAGIRGKFSGLGLDVDGFEHVAPAELPGITQPQKYAVTGYTKITKEITATTLDEAVNKFLQQTPGSTVTEVTVKFT